MFEQLGLCERALGDIDAAERMFERAITIQAQAHGEQHPSIATSLNNLAFIAQLGGDLGRADRLHRRAREMTEATLDGSPTHSASESRLGSTATASGPPPSAHR